MNRIKFNTAAKRNLSSIHTRRLSCSSSSVVRGVMGLLVKIIWLHQRAQAFLVNDKIVTFRQVLDVNAIDIFLDRIKRRRYEIA